jgi:hypothetical protein
MSNQEPDFPQEMPPLDIDALNSKVDEMMEKELEKRDLPTSADIDKFVNRIEDVNQKVKDIISGKITLDDYDNAELAEYRKERTLKEI